MNDQEGLAEQFEGSRRHLRGVAYRILGSVSEADDAVQETWLRFSRADTSAVVNLDGWLKTVVGRVCLDLLRSRQTHRQAILDMQATAPGGGAASAGADPADEAAMADAVGPALLVVLDTLGPAERLAFVLHDLFSVPFDEVAAVVGRSPSAARQLASRARRRVRGTSPVTAGDRTGQVQQRRILEAFLAAARHGDFNALLAVLDPDIVVRGDAGAVRLGGPSEVRGAAAAAPIFAGRAQAAYPALVDGAVGVIVAPLGRLLLVLRPTYDGDRITSIDVIADPSAIRRLRLSVLPG